MSAKLISVIGPPAVGKTTLAEQLTEAMPAELIREDYAGNPFLASSYTGSKKADLPSQLYFFMSRLKQLAQANWPIGGLFVSDYGFCQDRIYARSRLINKDYQLYDSIAQHMEGLVHPPDLIIHLDAAETTLLERIARRGREFEKSMTREFLAAMRREYNEFGQAAKCPVISLDCEKADFLDDTTRQSLLADAKSRLGE
ncbi:MAG: deoxynucleoside kinase [Phycisphaerae bacterium]|nr:deoxynucleoside kinase [Phycisphaerae bacterium]